MPSAVRVVTRIQDQDDFAGGLTDGYFLSYVASAGRFQLASVPGGGGGASGADPTASVGLTAVNGVATTFMRSDAAPPIDQAISPLWTGQHVFAISSASVVPVIVKGASSQSADLQQWQNSSGAIVASVSPDGSAAFGDPTVNGTFSVTARRFNLWNNSQVRAYAELDGDGVGWKFLTSSGVNYLFNDNGSGIGQIIGGNSGSGFTIRPKGNDFGAYSGTGAPMTVIAGPTSGTTGGQLYLSGSGGSSTNGDVHLNYDGTTARGNTYVHGNLVVTGTDLQCAIDTTSYSRLNFRKNGTNKGLVAFNLNGNDNDLGLSADGGSDFPIVILGDGTNRIVLKGGGAPAAISSVVDISAYGNSGNHNVMVLRHAASRSIATLQLQTSAGASLGTVGGSIFDHFTDGATISTNGTEDDLYSDTTVANTFAVNGDAIEATYCVEFVASATATRRIQLYFAGIQILDSGTLTFAAGGTANIWVTLIRESSSVVRVKAEFVPSGITLQPIVKYTHVTSLTLTTTNILKVTGIATGTGSAASDIVARLGKVLLFPVS